MGELDDLIQKRRAYRSLRPAAISGEMIRKLAGAASLSASCNNNQPWRFVFVTDPGILMGLAGTMSKNNDWSRSASMIIGVVSRKELDCMPGDRDYYLFDTGMASAFLILKATDMGLVAHPIAGYDEARAKEVLKIPEEMRLITLIICGEHDEAMNPLLTESQVKREIPRPERKPLDEIMRLNRF